MWRIGRLVPAFLNEKRRRSNWSAQIAPFVRFRTLVTLSLKLTCTQPQPFHVIVDFPDIVLRAYGIAPPGGQGGNNGPGGPPAPPPPPEPFDDFVGQPLPLMPGFFNNNHPPPPPPPPAHQGQAGQQSAVTHRSRGVREAPPASQLTRQQSPVAHRILAAISSALSSDNEDHSVKNEQDVADEEAEEAAFLAAQALSLSQLREEFNADTGTRASGSRLSSPQPNAGTWVFVPSSQDPSTPRRQQPGGTSSGKGKGKQL